MIPDLNSPRTQPPRLAGTTALAPASRPCLLDQKEWLHRELRDLAVKLESEGRRDTADRVLGVASEIRELHGPIPGTPAPGVEADEETFCLAGDGRELVVKRRIPAPPEVVFRVWTTRLPDWWGPHGMSTPEWQIDLRTGGVFRTLMRTADGMEYRTHGLVLEVTPARRLVFTDAFDAGWEPRPEAFLVTVANFDRTADNGTDCTVCARHWCDGSAVRHVRMGFYPVWTESLDRLAHCCATA